MRAPSSSGGPVLLPDPPPFLPPPWRPPRLLALLRSTVLAGSTVKRSNSATPPPPPPPPPRRAPRCCCLTTSLSHSDPWRTLPLYLAEADREEDEVTPIAVLSLSQTAATCPPSLDDGLSYLTLLPNLPVTSGMRIVLLLLLLLLLRSIHPIPFFHMGSQIDKTFSPLSFIDSAAEERKKGGGLTSAPSV